MSAAQLRRHHQQQAGLNVCWQRYCSLRQGVLEAANATGHPTSNISKLDAQLEASLVIPDHRASVNNLPPLSGEKRRRDNDCDNMDDGDNDDAGINNQPQQQQAGIEPLMAVAEAFSHELQTLKDNEHFRGSARDVEVMADMMRCLAGGMDDAEALLFMENMSVMNTDVDVHGSGSSNQGSRANIIPSGP